eukprot:2083501-Pleurochrysis_carterae.AAC.5
MPRPKVARRQSARWIGASLGMLTSHNSALTIIASMIEAECTIQPVTSLIRLEENRCPVQVVHVPKLVPREEERERLPPLDHFGRARPPPSTERMRGAVSRHVNECSAANLKPGAAHGSRERRVEQRRQRRQRRCRRLDGGGRRGGQRRGQP